MIFDVIDVGSGATVASVVGAGAMEGLTGTSDAGIWVGSTTSGIGVVVGLAAPPQAVNNRTQTRISAALYRFRIPLPWTFKFDLH